MSATMDNMLDAHAAEVLEVLPVGIMLADEAGAVSYANRTALEFLGIEREGLKEINIRGMFRQNTGKKDIMLRTKGKDRITVRLNRIALSGGCSAVVMTDITEIQQLEQELLKMDKLATVGELTSGIAHEIRNPLAGIKTTAQALKGRYRTTITASPTYPGSSPRSTGSTSCCSISSTSPSPRI